MIALIILFVCGLLSLAAILLISKHTHHRAELESDARHLEKFAEEERRRAYLHRMKVIQANSRYTSLRTIDVDIIALLHESEYELERKIRTKHAESIKAYGYVREVEDRVALILQGVREAYESIRLIV